MINPSKVKFVSEELEKEFNSLDEEDILKKSIKRAIQDLQTDAFFGTQIPKRLFPKEYIQKYGITNLWKYDLPNSWRLIYTLTKEGEIEIISAFLNGSTTKIMKGDLIIKMEPKLISQGAEAKIFLAEDKIIKNRIPKSYRHPQLDNQIRKHRTKSETKILIKAKELGINVPKIILENNFPHEIIIEFIDGDRLSETLNCYPEKKQFEVMQKLGEQVALLHKNNIIHGDLTTSNVILKDKKIFIIDFGLGFISTKIEDKAVDLHLIKQALEAKHFQNNEKLFKQFLKTYKHPETKKVLEQLKKVEARGRYKQ